MVYLAVALSAALGGFVQSITGFGAAVVMMTILPYFFTMAVAPSVSTSICLGLTVTLAWKLRKSIDLKLTLPPTLLYAAASVTAIRFIGSMDLRVMTMVFDEVDTGVSGRAAQRVAEKLRALSRTKQVLCVTHLPQIAALADTHFRIAKAEHDGRTALGGRADEPVPVGLIPADGGEQVAGLRGARVKADIPDVQFRIGGAFAHVQNGQQSLEFHKRTSVVRQYRPSMPESLVTSVTSTTVP